MKQHTHCYWINQSGSGVLAEFVCFTFVLLVFIELETEEFFLNDLYCRLLHLQTGLE